MECLGNLTAAVAATATFFIDISLFLVLIIESFYIYNFSF